MHISARPPGAVARTRVAIDNPEAQPSSAPKAAAMTIPARTLTRTAVTYRGALRSERRSKREPSVQPMATCAALLRTPGIEEKCRSEVVRAIVRASGPNMNAFGSRERSEEHTSELQSPDHLVCRLLLEKKKKTPD